MAAEDDIASLETQLGTGVVQVRHSDGRMVQYATTDEKLKALGYLRTKAVGSFQRTTLLAFVRD